MAGLFNKLPKAFAKVTAYTCENIINEVVKEECRYWKEDEELDEKYNSLDDNYEEYESVEHYLDEA